MVPWQIITTVSAVCSAIIIIWGFGKNLFKGAAETYEKHENIEKIPTMLDMMQKISDSIDDLTKKYSELEEKMDSLSNSFLEEQKHEKNERDLLLSVARQILLDEMERAMDVGEETPERKVVLGELYKHYLGNNGNGTVKKMWEQYYMTLPLK